LAASFAISAEGRKEIAMALVPAQNNAGGAQGSGEVTTLLGRGSEFEGKLSFEGTVRVDGKLSGEIFTDDTLIIGEGAEVNAEISVGSIIIEGTVHGNIHAKRSVEIHTPARVRGNISTPSLSIDKGVVFDGQCQMEQNGAAAGAKGRAGDRSGGSSVSEATID
jgi:cytoskeletal protein CcmA (bactofilin family)